MLRSPDVTTVTQAQNGDRDRRFRPTVSAQTQPVGLAEALPDGGVHAGGCGRGNFEAY